VPKIIRNGGQDGSSKMYLNINYPFMNQYGSNLNRMRKNSKAAAKMAA